MYYSGCPLSCWFGSTSTGRVEALRRTGTQKRRKERLIFWPKIAAAGFLFGFITTNKQPGIKTISAKKDYSTSINHKIVVQSQFLQCFVFCNADRLKQDKKSLQMHIDYLSLTIYLCWLSSLILFSFDNNCSDLHN